MWTNRSTDMPPQKGLGFHVDQSFCRHAAPKDIPGTRNKFSNYYYFYKKPR